MMNRWSVLLLIVGAIAGYVISGTSVAAQTDPLPVAVGETITLRYSTDAHHSGDHRWVECSVVEIRGVYVKCAPPAQRRVGAPTVVLWRNLQTVAIIQKDQ